MRINKSNKSAVKASTSPIDYKEELLNTNNPKELMDILGKASDDDSISDVVYSELYKIAVKQGVEASKKLSANDQALTHIKAAIDILGKSGNKDAVTKDSIANLATVMFDLKGSETK